MRSQTAIRSDQLPDYLQAFRGSFTSLLRWDDLDAFWQVLEARADANWYIYAIGEPVPDMPASADQVKTFIAEIDKLLRQEHDGFGHSERPYIDSTRSSNMPIIEDRFNFCVAVNSPSS
ncbi:MAG: hypothetical protein P8Z67_00330 [Gammaproteobacteria bacterium]